MKPLGTNIIVDPLYDPPTAETGLSPGAPALYLPDSGKNPMSQQGIVVAVGPHQEVVKVGDHVLYHPFVQHPFCIAGREYLHVAARHIVGRLDLAGNLIPLPWDVVVKPEFGKAGRPVLEKLLWLPRQVFNIEVPCTGKVEKIGAMVTLVKDGQRILYPPEAGSEVGLKRVWYVLHEKDILAVLKTKARFRVTLTGGGNARSPHY